MTLNEENSRVVLLGCFIAIYVVLGAVIIRKFEYPFEKRLLRNYWRMYEEFGGKLINGTAQLDDLNSLLYAYGNMTSALGAPGKYERWNFLGSLYFVVTIVTTIGYGSYTPNTNGGKIFVVLYGLLGCASGILFFNLFLERVITFLAFFLREFYLRKLFNRPEKGENEFDDRSTEEWKPSVYSVLACLLLASILMVCIVVPVYSAIENWSYIDAIYFCFVSFATIGFGDFVAAQKSEYQYTSLYVLANVVILAIGCCFLYSLFNVISIVLKQSLNWLIHRLNAFQVYCHKYLIRRHPDRMLRKYSLKMQKERKNQCRRSSVAIIGRTLKRKATAQLQEPETDYGAPVKCNIDRNMELVVDRKLSDDGLISMKDFFTSNQVSLALMQKQLQDSARESAGSSHSINIIVTSAAPSTSDAAATPSAPHKPSFPAGRFIPGTIGPLAILCDKLGDK